MTTNPFAEDHLPEGQPLIETKNASGLDPLCGSSRTRSAVPLRWESLPDWRVWAKTIAIQH